MPTYYGRDRRGAAESWRALRRRRANPPVPRGRSAARAATFLSALGQAEQQFHAAAGIGYQSRALNLYYGLSQAGRALAAVAPELGNGDWQLDGHGLTVPNRNQFSGGDVGALRLRTDGVAGGRTSFQRLSTVLNSDVPESFALGDVWPLVYETANAPIGSALTVPMIVTIHSGLLPNGGAGAVNASVELPEAVRGERPDRPGLHEFLEWYPGLRGWEQNLPTGQALGWPVNQSNLNLRWDTTGQHLAGPAALAARLTRYRGLTFAFPVLSGSRGTFHPLMVWFSVLYGLSMLTRYMPDQWTRLVDVDQCAQATAIEFVLDTALDAVPDLLDEAISSLTT